MVRIWVHILDPYISLFDTRLFEKQQKHRFLNFFEQLKKDEASSCATKVSHLGGP